LILKQRPTLSESKTNAATAEICQPMKAETIQGNKRTDPDGQYLNNICGGGDSPSLSARRVQCFRGQQLLAAATTRTAAGVLAPVLASTRNSTSSVVAVPEPRQWQCTEGHYLTTRTNTELVQY
jgi:hypothetical protein